MTSLTAPALAVDPTFDYTRLLRGEGPVWQIISERPMHLLDPKYKNWDDAILDTVDAVIAQLTDGGKSLADRTWGEANSAEIRHPLAGAIPFFGRYLNMPGDPLARRCLHAAREHAAHRTVGANGRLTWSRERRHSRNPDRSKRPSALAALRRSIPRVAHRRADAVPAGSHRHHAHAHTTPMNRLNRRDFLKLSGAAAASLNLHRNT